MSVLDDTTIEKLKAQLAEHEAEIKLLRAQIDERESAANVIRRMLREDKAARVGFRLYMELKPTLSFADAIRKHNDEYTVQLYTKVPVLQLRDVYLMDGVMFGSVGYEIWSIGAIPLSVIREMREAYEREGGAE